MLEEAGFRVHVGSAGRQVVGSTGGETRLDRGLVTCWGSGSDRTIHVHRRSAIYSQTGSFRVRIAPREEGVGLTFDARFQAPRCPSSTNRERPQAMCALITCESTGVLEQRVAERIAGTGSG